VKAVLDQPSAEKGFLPPAQGIAGLEPRERYRVRASVVRDDAVDSVRYINHTSASPGIQKIAEIGVAHAANTHGRPTRHRVAIGRQIVQMSTVKGLYTRSSAQAQGPDQIARSRRGRW